MAIPAIIAMLKSSLYISSAFSSYRLLEDCFEFNNIGRNAVNQFVTRLWSLTKPDFLTVLDYPFQSNGNLTRSP